MDWKFFWASVATDILLLAGLFYLLKKLIEKKIAEDTKQYEHTLSRGLEEFKKQLGDEHSALQHCFDKTVAAFTNRNSVLTTKQAEALGEIHSLIYDAWTGLIELRYCKKENSDDKHLLARTACGKALDYFRPRRIYLPKSVCDSTMTLINRLMTTCDHYSAAQRLDEHDQRYREFLTDVQGLQHTVMTLILELEEEYRNLLSGRTDTTAPRSESTDNQCL